MIVITNQTAIEGEAATINALFNHGLKLLHIRKPDVSAEEVRHLVEAIESRYHQQLALHQYHEIAPEYGINRLHYTETVRLKQSEKQLVALKQKGLTLSTSVHNWQSYAQLHSMFSYAFIGPVFNSISKEGYDAMKYTGVAEKNNDIGRIAIGGISKENCNNAILKAFEGVAVLGAIWQSKMPLQEFKLLQGTWITTGQ